MSTPLLTNATTLIAGTGVQIAPAPVDIFLFNVTATNDYFVYLQIQQSPDNVNWTTIKTFEVMGEYQYNDSFSTDVPSLYYLRGVISGIFGANTTVNLSFLQTLDNVYPDLSKVVRFDAPQTLTDAEVLQVNLNIGIGDPNTDFVAIFNNGLI